MNRSLRIQICSGYPLESPKGNSVTAKRLASLFVQRGHDAFAVCTDQPSPSDVFIGLHAFNTFPAACHFRTRCPDGSLLVLLTGTDIYGGFEGNQAAIATLSEIVDHFVVAHPNALSALPSQWTPKTSVIYPSVSIPRSPIHLEPQIPRQPYFACVGHLRPVKNPHLMFRALGFLEQDHFRAYSIGAALDPEDGEMANRNQEVDSRYRWLTGLGQAAAIEWIRQATAMINTSFAEGGANVILEACRVETPVLATRIDGNVGLLGDDYAGYFPSDDARALSQLMQRCLADDAFRSLLKQQVMNRGALFTNRKEVEAWLDLIQTL